MVIASNTCILMSNSNVHVEEGSTITDKPSSEIIIEIENQTNNETITNAQFSQQ